MNNRKITIARELTKVHEEFIRGNIDDIEDNIANVKGEFVLVIQGNEDPDDDIFSNMTLEEHFQYYVQKGLEKKEIVKAIAKDRKVNKNEIYKYFLDK